MHVKIHSLQAVLFASVTLAAGCAVPLGPGYRFSLRKSEVSGVTARPAHLHVHITDTLRNVGNRDLAFLDVVPPLVAGSTVSGLQYAVEQGGSSEFAAGGGTARSVRVSLPLAWAPGQLRQFSFDYDVSSGPRVASSAVSASGFFLADPSAFPAWVTPPGPFSYGSFRAVEERLQVTVPADWLILGAGNHHRKTLSGGLVQHEFRMEGGDVSPFLVTGHYQASQIKTDSGSVVIWSVGSLKAEPVNAVARRLAAAAAADREIFGPFPQAARSIYIVEIPPDERPMGNDEAGARAASFPGGVLIDQQAFTEGSDSEPVMRDAERALAQMWFGWRVHPQPESQLARGLVWFPIVLSAEARGGPAARNRMVEEWIEAFDSLSNGATSSRRLASERSDLAADYHAALFWVALENLAGKEKFSRAMQHIVRSLSGTEAGDEELRSALEQETDLNLAETFRLWSSQRELPADFRARYSVRQ